MNEIILTFEEYTKLITEKNGFQIGFIISISLLSALSVTILFFIISKLYLKYEDSSL